MKNMHTQTVILSAVALLLVGAYVLTRNTRPIPITAPPINTSTTISYLTSSADRATYCNGADMDTAGYQKTLTIEQSTSTSLVNPTKLQLIKATVDAATQGMCRTALDQLDITENNGIVSIPPIDAWAGVSIVMCSCKPEVETNLLRIPGITQVVWQTEKTSLIQVETPQPNQTITSPLTIKGQARGSWFFEASFPIVLVDWDGKIIAQTTAQAKSNWMTTEFVPFEATLTFTTPKTAPRKNGTLILRKDNPSGLPEYDDAFEVPIIFATTSTQVRACTLEAKICPDGSAVGRTGPNCEFAACPTK